MNNAILVIKRSWPLVAKEFSDISLRHSDIKIEILLPRYTINEKPKKPKYFLIHVFLYSLYHVLKLIKQTFNLKILY